MKLGVKTVVGYEKGILGKATRTVYKLLALVLSMCNWCAGPAGQKYLQCAHDILCRLVIRKQPGDVVFDAYISALVFESPLLLPIASVRFFVL